MNFYSAARRADQPLDDDCILVAFVLEKDGILRFIDKLRDAFSAVAGTPD